MVAQKEALVAQVGTLEEQLKGKTAELASGGDQSASGKWTYRVEPVEDASKPAFYYKTAEKKKLHQFSKWKRNNNFKCYGRFYYI